MRQTPEVTLRQNHDARAGDTQRPRAARRVRPAPRRKGLYAECLQTYLAAVAQLPQDRMLDRILLRTGSRRGVDLMSLWATDARLRYQDLLNHINAPGSDWQTLLASTAGALRPAVLARIARVVALQEVGPDDRANALAILRWLSGQCGADLFNRDEQRLFQNLAFVQGDFALANELLHNLDLSRTDSLTMRADLANPWGPSTYADHATWRASFSALFERYRLEAPSITIENSLTGEAFDGLQCPVAGNVDDGPLVSVIMTAWQPGPELESSLRSILNQTWRNLEVLLVDDASPPAYQEVLLRAQAVDPRVRLLQQPENGGTYVARSAALAVARGDFVTGQDSDDWSHPRRIEKQCVAMLSDAKLVSTTSHALRCDPSMLFVAPGMLARRENASSLMFRRQAAIENVGYYDATRKGGDTEYILRLHKVFGKHSHRLLEKDLALIRRSRESLSHAEFRPGWRHPARSAYRRSYEFWHQFEGSQDALKLEGQPESIRRFPLPQRFAVRSASAACKAYDVVFIDDFRPCTGVGHLRALLDEIRCLLAAGLRVGVTHLRSFRDLSFEPIDNYWPPIARSIHEGVVDEVLLTDPYEVGTIVVRRPEVAVFFSPAGTVLRPAKIIVVAEEAVRQPHKRVWYEPMACHRNLREAFAAPVEWAAGTRVKPDLVAALPASSKVGKAYPIVVDARSWRYPARAAAERPPVLGYVPDPGRIDGGGGVADLSVIFSENSSALLRFFGSEAALLAELCRDRLPDNWSCSRDNADLEAFLGACDFLVHLDCATGYPMQKRLFSQAMASGCVVITTPACAATCRGVIGCELDEVRTLVEDLWRDKAKYRNQVDWGLRSIREQDGSRKRHAQLVSMLGGASDEPGRLEQQPEKRRNQIEPGRVGGSRVSRVVRQHAEMYQARGFVREIDRTILRTGSLEGRDILACMASRGGLDWARIREMLSEYRAGRQTTLTHRVFRELDPRFTRRLGRVVALQALLPDDRISALTLFKVMIEAQGTRALDPQHSKLALDLAFYLRDWPFIARYRDQLSFNETARRFMDLDLHNPFIDSPLADQAKWLDLLNQHYLEAGIAPLQLEEPSDPASLPFDRLSTGPLVEIADGALVTVVTTSWHPDESLVHAMRSITRQTWRNLEILLIDDASPAEFVPLLESVAASDPRIRLIRQARNGGTYVARNRGMTEAKGRYFTVHDSDDWAHPQRIELQVAALQSDAKLVSSGSFAFRCNDDLVVNFPGVMPDRENASSLTFELAKVRERIGYFDESRKGADTEYVLRMRAAFGEDSHRVLGEPLAMIRLRPDSLSRAEFKPGWRHPARAMYRRGYEAWHRRIRHDPAGAYLPSPLGERPFSLPARFQVERRNSDVGDASRAYDIVFAADFRASASLDRSICHELIAAQRAGLRTGILHLESFWHASLREIEPFDPDVEQLLHEKLIDEVLYTDSHGVGLLVIRDPSVLQFPLPHPSALAVARAVIVSADGGGARTNTPTFDAGDCANHTFRVFGIEPKWYAQDEDAIAALAADVSVRMIDLPNWPKEVVIGPAPSTTGTYRKDSSIPGQRTSVGHIVTTDPPEAIADWVTVFGGVSAGKSLRLLATRDLAVGEYANVVIEPYWTPRLAFLRRCDFYTDHPATAGDESQYRWILEAMAQGCVPILSPGWEPVFGRAAQYCMPQALTARMSALAASEGGVADARERALDCANRHNGARYLPFWGLTGVWPEGENPERSSDSDAGFKRRLN